MKEALHTEVMLMCCTLRLGPCPMYFMFMDFIFNCVLTFFWYSQGPCQHAIKALYSVLTSLASFCRTV